MHTRKKELFFILLFVFISIGGVAVFPYVNKYIRYIEFGTKAGIEKIDFYGKLVDQHGKPVSDAILYYEIAGRYLAGGKGINAVSSDIDGKFEIHSEGVSLILRNIEHPKVMFQYPPPEYAGTHEPRNVSITFYGYQQVQGGNAKLWTDTSSLSPYLIKGWRAEQYENVISGILYGYYKSDGRVYTLNFSGQSYDKIKNEGLVEGHIHVSCAREELNDDARDVDWKIVIKPLQGGIQGTDDHYLNQAPMEGYKNSVEIIMNKNDQNYERSLVNKRYYFTAHDQIVYGSLYINYLPHAKNDKCGIHITQYKINVEGSQNLAKK